MLLYSTLFISCSNTETDEDLKLYENEEFFAEDTGEDPPPPPPVDPGDD